MSWQVSAHRANENSTLLKSVFHVCAGASPHRIGRRGSGRLLIYVVWLFFCASPLIYASPSRSPVNQIFQWSVSGTSEGWADGSRKDATAFLWIPEDCLRLRGLLILGTNVPEHMLVGHESIREVCRKNNLGIVWAVPSFWHFAAAAKGRDRQQVEFLEELLHSLADISGYGEVAEVPWLPIGESGHLLMVGGLIRERPERSIAGICVKNPGSRSAEVPVLWTLGTGQEWKQTEVETGANWLNTGGYDAWCRERAANSEPLSIAIEPGTGHFYCSEEMTRLFAAYIDAVVRVRLPEKPGEPLRAVNLSDGVLAGLPLPGQRDLKIIPYADATPDQLARPWFFDADLARQAQGLAAVDWGADPQLVAFTPGFGSRVEPYSLNSVTEIFVEGDGEFAIGSKLLAEVPGNFPDAGAKLARGPGHPVIEWICGPFSPAGEGRFRVALDRTWTGRGAAYIIARHEGAPGIRRSVQPARVALVPNATGRPQTIDFAPISDVPRGTTTIPLSATSDGGLPVSFFVDHGPATVADGSLQLQPLPPRARYPVEVAVTAWQWGRHSEPSVQTAKPVRRTFKILAP